MWGVGTLTMFAFVSIEKNFFLQPILSATAHSSDGQINVSCSPIFTQNCDHDNDNCILMHYKICGLPDTTTVILQVYLAYTYSKMEFYVC